MEAREERVKARALQDAGYIPLRAGGPMLGDLKEGHRVAWNPAFETPDFIEWNRKTLVYWEHPVEAFCESLSRALAGRLLFHTNLRRTDGASDPIEDVRWTPEWLARIAHSAPPEPVRACRLQSIVNAILASPELQAAVLSTHALGGNIALMHLLFELEEDL